MFLVTTREQYIEGAVEGIRQPQRIAPAIRLELGSPGANYASSERSSLGGGGCRQPERLPKVDLGIPRPQQPRSARSHRRPGLFSPRNGSVRGAHPPPRIAG